MSETGLAVLALGLPLLATLVTPLFGAGRARRLAHLPAVVGFGAAAVAAVVLLVRVAEDPAPERTPGASMHLLTFLSGQTPLFKATPDPVHWFEAGDVRANVTFTVDPLAAVMLATVLFIATWIAVFSAGYMRGEEGYVRYFTLISLFVFCMCLLVLANNFLLLLAGWEGVGLCSYLLVGYYYAKPSAADAARKAFLVTRLGDTGLLVGVFLLWQAAGFHLDMDRAFEHIAKSPPPAGTMEAIALLLFCGAVGKSAQLPLYVWLPDAMEGPTPVSALIHAATMVTAGVYLLARCAPLFVLAPAAQLTVSLIGGLTAFLAAFIALTQTDLKRILAYSTVSQLGFMFMALGTAGAITPSVAVAAAVFHLFTHAFFKALLFLGSGSVMHAMGGEIDLRKFGGLRRRMPVTHLTFLCGAAALAGLPPLAGFWSKDLILDALDTAGERAVVYRAGYWVVFGLALVTALLTAFYTFRAYFLTFWGPERVPEAARDHAHESPPVMTVPLVVLAVGAVAAGFFAGPVSHFLAESRSVELANDLYRAKYNIAPAGHEFSWVIAGLGTAAALVGLAAAYRVYHAGRIEEVPEEFRGVYALSRNKAYVDEVYAGTVVRPAEFLASAGRAFDAFLDAVARLVAHAPRLGAGLLRPLQNGLVQFYALGMVLGLAVFVTFIVFRVTR